MTNAPGHRGPITRADELEVTADAVARESWSPLPPGSHVRVKGRRGPSAVALQHQPGGTYVLTASGGRMRLSKERHLVIGPLRPTPHLAAVQSAPANAVEEVGEPSSAEEIDIAAAHMIRTAHASKGAWDVKRLDDANAFIRRLAELGASFVGEDRSDDPAAQLDADRTALSLVEAMTDRVDEDALTAVVPTSVHDANAVALRLARMLALELDEDAPDAIAAARARLLQTEAELNQNTEDAS